MSDSELRLHSAGERRMASYLGRIATGPTLSKDLSRAETRAGMELVLRGEVGSAQAAVFLIALRMKRETHDELCGVLDALRANARVAAAPVDELVDMAEPYNGYVRHLPAAPFVPAVLAACGLATVLHGCHEAGPKWGITAHRILAAAGARVDASSQQAASRIASAGWAYVDLPQFCPPLANIARLRSLIVKRPCLSLLEKLIAPIGPRPGGRMHLWVGYAHREYPEILEALAREFGYHSMLAVRGVEGGVTTTLAGKARGFGFVGTGALAELGIEARAALGASADERAPVLPPAPARAAGAAQGTDGRPAPGASGQDAGADSDSSDSGPPSPERLADWAAAAARAGLDALAGAPGPTADMLVVSAAAMLRHVGRVETLAEGAQAARTVLNDGSARERFEAAWP